VHAFDPQESADKRLRLDDQRVGGQRRSRKNDRAAGAGDRQRGPRRVHRPGQLDGDVHADAAGGGLGERLQLQEVGAGVRRAKVHRRAGAGGVAVDRDHHPSRVLPPRHRARRQPEHARPEHRHRQTWAVPPRKPRPQRCRHRRRRTVRQRHHSRIHYLGQLDDPRPSRQ